MSLNLVNSPQTSRVGDKHSPYDLIVIGGGINGAVKSGRGKDGLIANVVWIKK